MLKKLKNRYTLFGILLFIMFLALVAQLAILQIQRGAAYSKEADGRRVRTVTSSAPRGMILDRYGRVLAGNRQGYKVQLLVNEIPKNQLNNIILNAVNLVEKNGDHYENNLLFQYWPEINKFEWNSRDLTLWKNQNQITENASASEAFATLKERYKMSSEMTMKNSFTAVALRTQINTAEIEGGERILLTNLLDETYLPELENLVNRYPNELMVEESEDDSKPMFALSLQPIIKPHESENKLCNDLIKTLPPEELVAVRRFPMILLENGKLEWMTKEIRTWKKANNIKEEMGASASFNFLMDKYKISKSLSSQNAVKIISIRIAITQLGYRAYFPVLIANDVSVETVAGIEEHSLELPGVIVENEMIRNYPNSNLLSPSLGYIGKITAEQAEEFKSKEYNISSDLIGRTGLESSMEEYLRGINGTKQVEVNQMGRSVRKLNEVSAIPGNNVILTIDAKVQKAAEEALEKTLQDIQKGEYGERFPNAKIGAAAVIDIKTGEVLALASFPSYDPNLFASGTIDNEVWKELNPRYPHPKDPLREDRDPTLPRPMLNNAITAAFPPGSTFKMIVGAAGLKEGVIGVTEKIYDEGRYTKLAKPGYESSAPACWLWNEARASHGWEDIVGAIRDSCNYYFFEVGNRLGIERIELYAKLFGLGVKTGIEIPGESSGNIAGEESSNRLIASIVTEKIKTSMKAKKGRDLSAEENKKATDISKDIIENFSLKTIRDHLVSLGYEKNDKKIIEIFDYVSQNRWTAGKTLNASIGQGEHNYTVLQMANYIAALTNGKDRFKPHIIKKVEDSQEKVLLEKQPEVAESISLSPEIHNAIMEGMSAVTSNTYQGRDGTAARFFKDFSIKVGGKTGTAQFTKGKDGYAWFVGFAPYDDPQIAVAVGIGQGGHGSYASPVAKAIFTEYLGLNEKKDISKSNELQP